MDLWAGAVQDWMTWVERSAYGYWLFSVGSRRPTLLAEYFKEREHINRKELTRFEAEWLETRQAEWGRAFWSRELIETPEGRRFRYFQNADDPALPSIGQTDGDFSLLLATIPPIAFVWAHKYAAEQERIPVDLRNNESRETETACDFLFCELSAAQSRARHGRLTVMEFEETIKELHPESHLLNPRRARVR